MPIAAFEACLSCGLRRGEVRGAHCRVSADREQFTLSFDCGVTAEQAQALAESFLVSKPRVRDLRIETPHGSWRWSEAGLEEHAGRIAAGVRFTVTTVDRIPEYPDFYERCLSAFRVRLAERWDHPGGNDYIRVLDGLEAIRRRPEMYIGAPLDPNWLFESVLEQAVLGWLAGTTRVIEVTLSATGTATVRDDGVPFSFEMGPDGVSWVHQSVGRLMVRQQWRRSDDRARRDFTFTPPALAIANALSSAFTVESTEGHQAHRQRYVRGRRLEPEAIRPSDGTSITFTPDPGFFDHPLDLLRVQASVERVASLCPGRQFTLNGELVCFGSLLAAVPRLQPTQVAWGGVVFEHTLRREDLVLRCALGLSEHATGHLECLLNLSRTAFTQGDGFRGDHLDAVLTAVADAVRIPGMRSAAREEDLVGVISLEMATPRLDRARALPVVRLDPGQIATIRESLLVPLSVFLDSIPESRETLADRCR